MFERKRGTCWLALRRWRISSRPFFMPLTKLIPSRIGPFEVQSSTSRTSRKRIGGGGSTAAARPPTCSPLPTFDALDADQRIGAEAVFAAAEASSRPPARARRPRGRILKCVHMIVSSAGHLPHPGGIGRVGLHGEVAGEGGLRLGRAALLHQRDAVPAPGVRRRVGIGDRGRIALRARGGRRPGGCAAARPRLRRSAAGRSSRPAPASRSDIGWRRDR